ncbi:hypothetical protein [Usitatibacter palustris]|uniref:DUF4124 domain-containing protein n=1 Tax=Usitatibacter palustris TaxID=2732487 RepID=A0A6M4H7Z9_9PROT|nr:hypothetical protein [Usitatibacter palustris]QJR14823.1 hypothetical protein DSM104440_01636 [Usitatibacter palustris]
MRLLLIVPLLWAGSVSAALHLCTDLQGKKVYQDTPCASLPSTSKIVPVKATAVTEENARETVKRFTAAMNAKDSVAAVGMASGYLQANVMVEGKVVNVSTTAFKELMHRVLIAADKYTVERDCQVVPDRDRPRETQLLCKVKESVKSSTRTHNYTYDERLRFAVEDGEVRIKVIQIEGT